MFVIEKFSIENVCYRKIFYRKCLLSENFLKKMFVIGKFSMENIVIDKSLNEPYNYRIFLTYLNVFNHFESFRF